MSVFFRRVFCGGSEDPMTNAHPVACIINDEFVSGKKLEVKHCRSETFLDIVC